MRTLLATMPSTLSLTRGVAFGANFVMTTPGLLARPTPPPTSATLRSAQRIGALELVPMLGMLDSRQKS